MSDSAINRYVFTYYAYTRRTLKRTRFQEGRRDQGHVVFHSADFHFASMTGSARQLMMMMNEKRLRERSEYSAKVKRVPPLFERTFETQTFKTNVAKRSLTR